MTLSERQHIVEWLAAYDADIQRQAHSTARTRLDAGPNHVRALLAALDAAAAETAQLRQERDRAIQERNRASEKGLTLLGLKAEAEARLSHARAALEDISLIADEATRQHAAKELRTLQGEAG